MNVTHLRKPTMLLALACWLFSVLVGLHGHVCLDGDAPPVAVHLGSSLHHAHDHEGDHAEDLDVDISQTSLAKIAKIQLDMPLVFLLLVLVALLPVQRRHTSAYVPPRCPTPDNLRPPLRAPPFFA